MSNPFTFLQAMETWYPPQTFGRESVLQAAAQLHRCTYILPGVYSATMDRYRRQLSRYDRLYRLLITFAVEYSVELGPMLVTRMWRWTGFMAPGGNQDLLVQRYMGREGLRNHITVSQESSFACQVQPTPGRDPGLIS
jgi:hypothetical protein